MKTLVLKPQLQLHITPEGETFAMTEDYTIVLNNVSKFQKLTFDDLVAIFNIFYEDSDDSLFKSLCKKYGIDQIFLTSVIVDEHGDVPNLDFNVYKYLIDNNLLF